MGGTGSILQIIKWATVGFSAAVLAKFDKEKGKAFLLNSFRDMPGLPAKFSQILEMGWQQDDQNRGASGKSSQNRGLNELENILPIEDVKSTIHAEIPKLFDDIDEIDSQGKSASLGQKWCFMTTVLGSKFLKIKV
jgi:hypothetical protein